MQLAAHAGAKAHERSGITGNVGLVKGDGRSGNGLAPFWRASNFFNVSIKKN